MYGKPIGPRIAVLLGLVAATALAIPRQSSGQFFLEPGLGLRSFSGDAGDVVGTGLVLSGLFGYVVSDYITVEGKLDLGIHGAGDESSVIDSGLSLFIGSGFMITPIKKEEGQQITLGIGSHFGRGALGIEYASGVIGPLGEDSDGIGAWVLDFGGYLGLMVSPTVELKANLNYGVWFWSDETREGYDSSDFDGNALTAVGSVAIHL